MRRSVQPLFPQFDGLNLRQFGGSLLKGNPKHARPISTKRPLHLVMRSSLAKGSHSFLAGSRARRVHQIVHQTGAKLGVKVYRYANSGNHLHIIVLPRSRQAFHAYIRAISGLIARTTLGVERGKKLGLKFWDARPFTRIVEWGRDYRRSCAYLMLNTLEAIGFFPLRSKKSAAPVKEKGS
jgi:hypothetical protein